MKILKKRGGGGNEIHAPCACEQLIQAYHRYGVGFAPGYFHISRHIAHLGWETPMSFTLFTLATYGTVVSNCF
jgi:hypothetical protein